MPDTPIEQALENLPLPPVYFEATRGVYWYEKGGWVRALEAHAIHHLHSLGISAVRSKGQPYSPAQLILKTCREKQVVCYAGPVAGLAPGVYGDGDGKYLSVGRPSLPVPTEGDWADIRILCERLFGTEEQLQYVWSWCKQAAEGIYLDKSKFSQALILAGGPGCGKSFFQVNVVSPLLGNRVAKPIQYMTGQTPFNADLIGCEHLMLQDENAKWDHLSRRALGTAIKGFTVNTSQRVHAKGKDAFVVDSKHWITLSINDEEENLNVLPQLDDSLKDKIIMVHCQPAVNQEWPGDFEAIQEMEERVRKQIPAFVHWLLNVYSIPLELQDTRFGVRGYQNEELVARIESGQPGAEFEELLDIACAAQAASPGYLVTDNVRLENWLRDNETVGGQIKRIYNVSWRTIVGSLRTLKGRKPLKFRQPLYDARYRPRPWVIVWKGDGPTDEQIRKSLDTQLKLEVAATMPRG